MKTEKEITCFLLSAAMIAALTGCPGGGSSGNNGDGANVTVSFAFEENSNLTLTYTDPVTKGTAQTITATANPSCTYTWYLNGVLRTETTGTITIATAGLVTGMQYGLAIITIDGSVFSKEFSFQVEE